MSAFGTSGHPNSRGHRRAAVTFKLWLARRTKFQGIKFTLVSDKRSAAVALACDGPIRMRNDRDRGHAGGECEDQHKG